MDILVTGGTGFIGSHLCRELDERGHEVTAMARNASDASLGDTIDTIEGDVTQFETLPPAIDGRDAVVHLVSLSPLFSPKGGPERHEIVTVGGTRNVVRAMAEANVDRLLYQSGMDADPNGPTAFIRSKGRAEEIVRASDLAWSITRPSAVFGAGGEFIPFIRTLTTPYLTALPGGGHTRFQPIWVEDLVKIMATVVESETHVEQIYDLGGPDVATLADITRLVHAVDRRSVYILPVPMIVARIALTAAGVIPFVPFGPDQYRSLTFDNTTSENAVDTVIGPTADLMSLREYLGVDV